MRVRQILSMGLASRFPAWRSFQASLQLRTAALRGDIIVALQRRKKQQHIQAQNPVATRVFHAAMCDVDLGRIKPLMIPYKA
jgi:hypothetical protein